MKPLGFAMVCLLVILGLASSADAVTQPGVTKATHLDLSKNSRYCAGCHISHGKGGRTMLRDTPERLCFICHGPFKKNPGNREEQAEEVYSLFQKRSKHPVVDTAQYHMQIEVLPEKDPSKPRHVSCSDCHEVHNLTNDSKMGKVRGVSFSGKRKVAEKDSEVCYKCHGDSVNRPSTSANMKLLFDPNNQSYHPIERASKKRSISLSKDAQKNQTIGCTDCHESHGSDYPPLLKKNYTTTEGAESSYAYDLCYSCHRRESILANESFSGPQAKPYGHREHLVLAKTSCRACHASHGSQINPSLIEFDRQVVTGAGQYVPGVKGSPTCILVCHGKDHVVSLEQQSIKKKK